MPKSPKFHGVMPNYMKEARFFQESGLLNWLLCVISLLHLGEIRERPHSINRRGCQNAAVDAQDNLYP
jgi:hypothetical protein